MESQGVFVQVEHPVFGLAKGSGLKINNIVLTHGMIFTPLCFTKDNEDLYKQYNTIMEELQGMQYFCNNSEICDSLIKFKVLRKNPNKVLGLGLSRTSEEDYILEEARLYLLHNYNKLPNITQEISNLFYSDSYNESDNHKFGSLVLPTLIFLVLGENLSRDSFDETLHSLHKTIKNIVLYPGLPLIVESTPFGTFSFMNSWSHGIISKIIGSDSEAILTDARLVSGCEGAPIYIFENGMKGALVGLVIQTLSWCNGEWIGFSLGLNIKHLLKSVLGLQSSTDYIPFNKSLMESPTSQLDLEQLFSSMVFVRCQHKWGSGVVINSARGLILTCSHIIDHAHDSVYVLCERGQFLASVLYASPLSAPYDLALLTVGKVPGLKQLAMAEKPPVTGERVFTAGYPLSTESLVSVNRTPVLSAGCVAKISTRGGPLQTTCCTQSGVSGGALIRPPAQLLGIVVSNIRLDSYTLSSFGFAVSIEDIKQPIMQYLQSNGTNEPVERVFALIVDIWSENESQLKCNFGIPWEQFLFITQKREEYSILASLSHPSHSDVPKVWSPDICTLPFDWP